MACAAVTIGSASASSLCLERQWLASLQAAISQNAAIPRAESQSSAGLGGLWLRWHRVVPAPVTRDELVSLRRAPGLRRIRRDGRDVEEHRVDDLPCRLNGVLAHEERCLAPHGIPQ